MSPEIARKVVLFFHHRRAAANEAMAQMELLTKRETEVLTLVALGETHKAIADKLGVSIKTVEFHKQHLMDKTGRHCIAALTRLAIATQLVKAE